MTSPAGIALGRAMYSHGHIFLLGATEETCVSVPIEAPEDFLREHSRSGDVLVIVENDSISLASRDRILKRCPAWGVSAIWLGNDNRPEEGSAICVQGANLSELILLGQQLTSTPELLAPAIVDCTDEVCVTCSDEGRIGEVISCPEALFMPATVRTSAGIEEVDVTIIGAVKAHDLILIHAGGAIALLNDSGIEVNS
ncbi:MAG: hypothetical protein KGM14_03375 [Actinomycetales bacterium]|nr:hypothetical protein [Actinomycetales bacterium]